MDLLSVLGPGPVTDEPIRPDQYRWVATRAWRLGTFTAPARPGTVHSHLAEHLVTQWVPRCPERDWLLDHRVTGVVCWLSGSEADAREAGFDPRDGVPTGRFRAPYGDFHAEAQGRRPGRRAQGWHLPTPEFLADLPREPDALRDRLCTDNPPSRYAGPFVAAAGALRTGLVPAPLRAALYCALAALPAVKVVHEVADLDGRPCTALVHDDGPTCTELLVDPRDGQFAGERDTLRRDSCCGLPTGTMIHASAMRTGVVDHLGEVPGPVVQLGPDD